MGQSHNRIELMPSQAPGIVVSSHFYRALTTCDYRILIDSADQSANISVTADSTGYEAVADQCVSTESYQTSSILISSDIHIGECNILDSCPVSTCKKAGSDEKGASNMQFVDRVSLSIVRTGKWSDRGVFPFSPPDGKKSNIFTVAGCKQGINVSSLDVMTGKAGTLVRVIGIQTGRSNPVEVLQTLYMIGVICSTVTCCRSNISGINISGMIRV